MTDTQQNKKSENKLKKDWAKIAIALVFGLTVIGVIGAKFIFPAHIGYTENGVSTKVGGDRIPFIDLGKPTEITNEEIQTVLENNKVIIANLGASQVANITDIMGQTDLAGKTMTFPEDLLLENGTYDIDYDLVTENMEDILPGASITGYTMYNKDVLTVDVEDVTYVFIKDTNSETFVCVGEINREPAEEITDEQQETVEDEQQETVEDEQQN